MVATEEVNISLHRARFLLAVLAGSDSGSALQAAEALAVIDDVQPPYPPVQPDPEAVGPPSPTEILDALTAAASGSVDPSEAVRIATAAAAFRAPFPG